MATIPLSPGLRARLQREAPHLAHHVVEAEHLDDVGVVDAAALPGVDDAGAGIAAGARVAASMPKALTDTTTSHAPAPTLWRQVPHDDPDAVLDGRLRAALISMLARGDDLDAARIAPTIAAHLDVEDELAGAIADELHQQLVADPALLPALQGAVDDERDDGLAPVGRATVVVVQRPTTTSGGGRDG